MTVYLLTALMSDGRSLVIGVYATQDLANARRDARNAASDGDTIFMVTATDVIDA